MLFKKFGFFFAFLFIANSTAWASPTLSSAHDTHTAVTQHTAKVDHTASKATPDHFWLLGYAPDYKAVYLDMFSLHFSSWRQLEKENWNNRMLSVGYHSFMAGIFLNSNYNWTYFIAFQHIWAKWHSGEHWRYELGYLAGIMHGYKYKNLKLFIAKYWLQPFIVPYFHVQYRFVGLQFMTFYKGVASSVYFTF